MLIQEYACLWTDRDGANTTFALRQLNLAVEDTLTEMVFECRSEKTTRWCELLSIVLSEFNLPRRACRKDILPTNHRFLP